MEKNMSGKMIVITGGTLGVGLAAARSFRQAGAQVAITGRSEGSAALAASLGCDFHRADYARLSDVRALAKTLLDKYPRIDVLANNVGGVMHHRTVSGDGHEMTFQVNHLGGFLLTLLLKERLEASGAIVINTASGAHTMGKLVLTDLENTDHYGAFRAYGTAKLMNILHARELNTRFKNIKAVSFHPGLVATGFGRAGSPLIKMLYASSLKRLFMISPEKGADTLEWLAASEPGKDWRPGEYYYKRKPGNKSKQASDALLGQKLWDASAACLGL